LYEVTCSRDGSGTPQDGNRLRLAVYGAAELAGADTGSAVAETVCRTRSITYSPVAAMEKV